MKAFEYAEPRNEAEAIELLSDEGVKTEVLAGGTDLVGLMKKVLVTPDRVVNIMEVPSLQTIEPQEDGALLIGAAVTLDEVLAHPYLENYPAISERLATWLAEQADDSPVVMVTHGQAGRVLRGRYLGLSPVETLVLPEPQTAAFHLADGKARLLEGNI